jgi:hypothetical protein
METIHDVVRRGELTDRSYDEERELIEAEGGVDPEETAADRTEPQDDDNEE